MYWYLYFNNFWENKISICKTHLAYAADTVDVDQGNKVHPIDNLPENEKQQIMKHVKHFHDEKRNFEREVAKWDDTGNDIVVLAKYMCTIMIQMTDFTHGRGRLKTTAEFIAAAQRISEAGEKMDSLVKEILKECPESSTKQDLLAYLQRIALYCQQMKITSKVKADVQSISEKLVISNVSSLTAWLLGSKNVGCVRLTVGSASGVQSGTAFITHIANKFIIFWWCEVGYSILDVYENPINDRNIAIIHPYRYYAAVFN